MASATKVERDVGERVQELCRSVSEAGRHFVEAASDRSVLTLALNENRDLQNKLRGRLHIVLGQEADDIAEELDHLWHRSRRLLDIQSSIGRIVVELKRMTEAIQAIGE
ncbi:MAG: hypothetical protein J5J06_02935 [Phycisphaerae bacterium]|nr:hypothetical protein [Phycisphaerae bacterium]